MSAEHKAAIQKSIERSLEISGTRKKTLAAQLALLVDGAIVRAHTLGDHNAARLAKTMAMRLLGPS